MARRFRSEQLETRSARLKLAVRKKPYFVKVGTGIGLGYRRNRFAGTWIVRVADGRGGNSVQAFATADDYADANANDVLDYWQAQQKARQIATREPRAAPEALPITVATALDEYEADVKTRGGDTSNVSRLRHNLPPSLLTKQVGGLSSRELRNWRDQLAK